MPAAVKLGILAVSGAFVAMAGVLWGMAWRTVSVDLVRPEQSLVLLAIPVIGGLGSLAGAVAGAVAVYMPAFFISPLLGSVFGSFGKQVGFQLALAGVGLVVVPLAYPAGIAGLARNAWQRLLDGIAASVDRRSATRGDERPLVVSAVAKRFGGLVVLDGVAIDVGPGRL